MIVPRPENTHPVTTVTKLSNVGVVIVGDSACSNTMNPGTRFTASLLARGEWG